MYKSTLLWVIAFLITAGSAVYQRKTGPTWPVEGEKVFENTAIKYILERNHTGDKDHNVKIEVSEKDISGILYFKRYKTGDSWTKIEMDYEDNFLTGFLPGQPPAGKLQYYIELSKGFKKLDLPEEGPVIIRFKNKEPAWALIPHIFFMFAAMLLSARTGLQVLAKGKNIRKYAVWTAVLMFIGGFIFGPIIQKYAFGDFWTGFPFGFDLTDNKTLIAMAAWVFALIMGKRSKNEDKWILAASVVTFVIFMIPHSLLGSELDYSKLPKN